MKILLIEDDNILAAFLIKGLVESGFTIDHSQDGEDGLHLSLAENYDVVIVDIMLPKKDGLSLIQEIRATKVNLPIIILSAKRSVEERIKGLQIGSDDYLVKPFDFLELLARIRALIRRSTSLPSPHRLEVGNLVLNLLTHEVKRGGKKIELNPKEFNILEFLVRYAGEIVTRTMLLERIWNFQFETGSNVVDVNIHRLREKIDKGFDYKLIHTIRGVGYILKMEEEDVHKI